MKIAKKISEYIKTEYNKEISLHEAKEVLDNGFFKLRGTKYDLSSIIKGIKEIYLKDEFYFLLVCIPTLKGIIKILSWLSIN